MNTQNTLSRPVETVCLPMEDMKTIFSLWAETLDKWCDEMCNEDLENPRLNESYLELCEKYTEYRKKFKS